MKNDPEHAKRAAELLVKYLFASPIIRGGSGDDPLREWLNELEAQLREIEDKAGVYFLKDVKELAIKLASSMPLRLDDWLEEIQESVLHSFLMPLSTEFGPAAREEFKESCLTAYEQIVGRARDHSDARFDRLIGASKEAPVSSEDKTRKRERTFSEDTLHGLGHSLTTLKNSSDGDKLDILMRRMDVFQDSQTDIKKDTKQSAVELERLLRDFQKEKAAAEEERKNAAEERIRATGGGGKEPIAVRNRSRRF